MIYKYKLPIDLTQIYIIQDDWDYKNISNSQISSNILAIRMGLQTSLCYDPQTSQPTHAWCSYQAVDNYSIIVQIIFLVALIILSIITALYFGKIVQYRKSNKYRKLFGDVFIRIYYIVFAWLLCSIIKVIINLGVYGQYMSQDFKQAHINNINNIQYDATDSDPPIDSPIVILSTIFSLLDFLASFFVLLLVWIIPCQWLLMVLLSIQQKQNISFSTRKKLVVYFTIVKIIRFYLYVLRQLYPVLLVAQPFLMFFTPFGCDMPFYNLLMVIIECGLIFAFYIFGYFVSQHLKKQKLINMKPEDYKKIRIQYFLLISCVIFRIILLIFFRIQIPGITVQYRPNSNCSDINYNNKIQTTIFLTIAQSVMHILPISVVLRIYRPSIEERKRDQSLLNATFTVTDSQERENERDRSLVQDNSSDYIKSTAQGGYDDLIEGLRMNKSETKSSKISENQSKYRYPESF